MIVPMKHRNCPRVIIKTISAFCCNHHFNEVLESFCKYFPLIILLLSQLFTEISSDEFTNQQQNENMKIFTKLLWYFTGMMIAAKDWNVSDYLHDCCVSLEKS